MLSRPDLSTPLGDLQRGREFRDHLRARQLVARLLARVVRLPPEELDEAVADGLGALGAWLGVDRVHVSRLDSGVVTRTHEWCDDGVQPGIALLQSVPVAQLGTWFEPHDGGDEGADVVRVDDVAALPDGRADERALLTAHGVRSLLVVPIRTHEGRVGVVGLESCREERRFDAGEVALLRSLGDTVVAAMARWDAVAAAEALALAHEEGLREAALLDELTGLPRRQLLRDRVLTSARRARRGGTLVGIVSLDVDGFRLVNDGRGHRAGDDLLVGVAHRLRESLRGGDTAARVGNDEFVVVIEDVGEVDEVEAAVARIRAALARPIVVEGVDHQVTASYGIATHDALGDVDVDALLLDAETAMCAARAEGRDRVAVHEPGMRSRAVRRGVVVERLAAAIAAEDIEVHFQPLVDLASRRVRGAEALARWRDDELGQVRPDEFIPMAEEAGLIRDLGLLVLRRACEAAAGWPSDLSVAVNLSPVQLADRSVAEQVLAVCRSAGLSPMRLEVEVTESTVLRDPVAARAVLTRLRRAGVRVALDDFGTGHSSLALLGDLPVDVVKIDRSFVSRMVDDTRNLRLVTAIVGVGDDLGFDVLAEGVETETQRLLLEDLGVLLAQGWLFGRAVDASDFRTLLASATHVVARVVR